MSRLRSLFLPAPDARGGLYRNLWRHAAGSRIALCAACVLLVASQLLRLAVPWYAGQAIDELQRGGHGYAAHAIAWIGALLVTSVIVWALHGPGRILEREVGVRVRRSVTAALLERVTNAPLPWHDRHPASDVQQRMLQASGALNEFAQSQYVILQGVITFVGTLAALVLFSPLVGAVAVGMYALLALVGTRFDRSMMRLAREENLAERRFASGVLESVGGIETVHALRLSPSVLRTLRTKLDAVFGPFSKGVRVNELKWAFVDLVTTAITWGVVALYVWVAHRDGSGHGGGAVLIGGVFMIYKYAEQASGVAGGAAGNIQHFMRLRVDFANADPIWSAPQRADVPAVTDRDWNTIELHHVSFAHAPAASDADDATTRRGGVHQVSLTLNRGERIALVGPSGSGKSTLMRIVAGLYEPDRGHATIDGVTHLGLRSVASHTTFVPQEPDVFEATLRDNLVFDHDPQPHELAAALATSAFDAVLETLPDGLATMAAERGANLSGGQRQRLGLARGVLAARDSSILLLDEPTSALDPLTENAVYRALAARFPDAAIVASVHRMNLLEHFDRVVLMADGRVVDTGTVDELKSRQPLFAAMLAGDDGSTPADPTRPTPVRAVA